jgi:hypothetical protein
LGRVRGWYDLRVSKTCDQTVATNHGLTTSLVFKPPLFLCEYFVAATSANVQKSYTRPPRQTLEPCGSTVVGGLLNRQRRTTTGFATPFFFVCPCLSGFFPRALVVRLDMRAPFRLSRSLYLRVNLCRLRRVLSVLRERLASFGFFQGSLPPGCQLRYLSRLGRCSREVLRLLSATSAVRSCVYGIWVQRYAMYCCRRRPGNVAYTCSVTPSLA